MKMTSQQVDRLSTAQNHMYNITQDIMTITAFFQTSEEVERHIERYEEYVEKFEKLPEKMKKKVLRGTVSLNEAAA